jgi:hypothetical protein
METRSPPTPLESPQQENAALIGLPQWMRDALSHQPAPTPPQQAGSVDEPADGERTNIRILSRVPSRLPD